MLAEAGSVLVGLALAAILYAACATLRSIRRPDPCWAQSGRNAIFWGGTFALVFSIWIRQRQLGRKMATLEAQLERKHTASETAQTPD